MFKFYNRGHVYYVSKVYYQGPGNQLIFQFFLRLEDIDKRKRKRRQVQKALERTFKEDDDVWVFHTRQCNQGTMEFVNLAFEPGKPEDNTTN